MADGGLMEISVKVDCTPCKGSGVYRSIGDPQGVGSVCLICGGTGYVQFKYVPFTERKRRIGIEKVYPPERKSTLFPEPYTGPHGNFISYEDFLNGKMPS